MATEEIKANELSLVTSPGDRFVVLFTQSNNAGVRISYENFIKPTNNTIAALDSRVVTLEDIVTAETYVLPWTNKFRSTLFEAISLLVARAVFIQDNLASPLTRTPNSSGIISLGLDVSMYPAVLSVYTVGAKYLCIPYVGGDNNDVWHAKILTTSMSPVTTEVTVVYHALYARIYVNSTTYNP